MLGVERSDRGFQLTTSMASGSISCCPNVREETVRELLALCGLREESMQVELDRIRRRVCEILRTTHGGNDVNATHPLGDAPTREPIGTWGDHPVTLRQRIASELQELGPIGFKLDPAVWASVPDYLLAWVDLELRDMLEDVSTSDSYWTKATLEIDAGELQGIAVNRFLEKIRPHYDLFSPANGAGGLSHGT